MCNFKGVYFLYDLAYQITEFYLTILFHPPSAFDTPNRITADFKVFSGLLRQRLRW